MGTTFSCHREFRHRRSYSLKATSFSPFPPLLLSILSPLFPPQPIQNLIKIPPFQTLTKFDDKFHIPITPSPSLSPQMKISPSTLFDLGSNDTAAGCLPGAFRRLLCGNSHCPKAQNAKEFEPDLTQEKKNTPSPSPPTSPGLIARLMGLESMPVTLPESIVRSRSTNSIEGWTGFLSGERNWAPKVRSCQSFREAPTFLRKENEEFLLLSFTPDDKGEAFELNGVKPKLESGSKKDFCKKRSGESSAKPRKQSELRERRRNERKKSVCALKKSELECSSSQTSSPVSVLDGSLDFDGSELTGPNSPIEEEDQKPKQQNFTKKLASSGPESPKLQLIKKSREEGLRLGKGKNRGKSTKGREDDILGKVCRLAEEDVRKSNWVRREVEKSEVHGKIGVVIGLEILDFLLQEAVLDLCGCST